MSILVLLSWGLGTQFGEVHTVFCFGLLGLQHSEIWTLFPRALRIWQLLLTVSVLRQKSFFPVSDTGWLAPTPGVLTLRCWAAGCKLVSATGMALVLWTYTHSKIHQKQPQQQQQQQQQRQQQPSGGRPPCRGGWAQYPSGFAPLRGSQEPARGHRCGWPPVESDTGQNYYNVWGRAFLPLERRITESAFSLGGGRGVWDLGGQGQGPSRSSRRWQAVAWRRRAGRWRRHGGSGTF